MVSWKLFERFAKKEAENLNLKLSQVEWCEQLYSRLQQNEIEDYLLDLADKINPGEGVFGRFHVWEEEK